MIKSEICVNLKGDIATKVELGVIDDNPVISLAQLEIELVGIYDSLEKKFSTDEAVELITSSVSHFLDAHK